MILDRKVAPEIHDAVEFEFNLPPITKNTLEAGIPLYWINAGVQDVVEIDWVFPNGVWNEQKPGVAYAVAALLKNGTDKKSALEIQSAIEFYGASLKIAAANDYTTVTLFALTKHLPNLLPLVYEVLTEASFPEKELDLYKKNSLQKLQVNLKQCEYVANQQIDAQLFGPSHPYGRYTTIDTINNLQKPDLVQYFNQNFDLSTIKIFMGGKVGEKEITLLNHFFGKITSQIGFETKGINSPIAPASNKNIFIQNDQNGVQGAIRIARLLPDRKHPDFPKLIMLNTLLGGYFGSRLMSNIREDKGYTYGIYSVINAYKSTSVFTIQTEVGAKVLPDSKIEIYKEIQRLIESPPTEDELLLVKNYLLGSLLGDLDGVFQILGRWRTLILNNLDEHFFNKNVTIYKNITAQEIQQLAIQYFQKNDFWEVVVI